MRITNFVAQTCRNIARNCKAVSLLTAIIAVSAIAATAQQQVWSENSQNRSSIATDKAVARQSFPQNFKLFNLDLGPLRTQLFSIVGDNARGQSTIITLPNANGTLERFEVFEASNFEPELQAQFPEIRAFSGRGLTDQYATLKLSISPQGIQTMVFRTDTDNEFIEPYSEDRNVYAVFKSSRDKGELPWACATEEKEFFSIWKSEMKFPILADAPDANSGQLKTMRLAQSCNGEYSNFFGATSAAQVNLVLAAYNATLTRANGVYEKDLAIHLNLIPETTRVIYYDPATDPYTTLGQWNNQLQATLTTNIGDENYDIGHMFGASGGGGNAGCIGCVCSAGIKGRGITSPADGIPQGDNFDIDYVVHEVGHQLGANHTFSHSLEGSGQNKEVGSGITIMGYAGITSFDVAPHSIDTFHATSIQQIQVNIATKQCPVTVNMTANQTPVVAPLTNYTIPITTPFALTGSATDPDGDALTYQWEQNDVSTVSGAASVASPTKTGGPNWLTFLPTASPTRMFPRLSTILAGQAVTGPLPGGDAVANIEALSSVSRTLNFRLTVRDNKPYVAGSTIGQTQFADTVVTVSNTGGPFKVTSANTTGTSALAGGQYNVTWDVNNTNAAPFNAANVKISLSTDGGQTFPTVLAASTANDGTESVTMPTATSTTARIKVEAIGNIFFDINDANFSISSSPSGPAAITSGNLAVTNEACGVPNGQPDPGETLTVSLPLANTGGAATGNLTATLQATGGVTTAVSQTYGTIAAGTAAVTRNFTFTVSSALTCGSPVTLTFVISDGSSTVYPNVVKVLQTGVASVSLTENFDGVTAPALPNGWTSVQTSGSGINWVTTTTNADSAPNAAFGNSPTTINTGALVSPAVTVNSTSAQLKFRNRYDLENGAGNEAYDGMVLEYSTNGTTWTDIVTGGGSFVSGGYNRPISTGFGSPIGGRQAWSGDSGGYIDTVVNLPASLNGQSVRFRWLIGTDEDTAETGAWVDGVQVLGGVTCNTNCSNPTNPSACTVNKRRNDFNGDGTTDFSVFRPSTGTWFYLGSGSNASAGYNFGTSSDKLVPADYDADGKTDYAVYRNGIWYWTQSSDATVKSAAFGAASDIPMAGDFTGDGKADLTVYRPSTGIWYTMNPVDQTMSAVQWGGTATDMPLVGDFDGDCKLDYAVRRTTNDPVTNATQYFILKSSGGVASARFGRSDMAMAIGDYNNDGKSDIGVVETRNGLYYWYALTAETNTVIVNGIQFGQTGDIVTAGDYNGDGATDLSVWRPTNGVFYHRGVTNATQFGQAFGTSTDIPTARAYQQP